MHSIVVAIALITPLFTASDSKSAWQSLKTMAGEWEGVANDGRKIRHTAELIAGGSVLMERSWFDAHPGELMVTMYHLDRDKLMLTHYCVAKNQPRLEATEISADAKTILFTFRDGTNLKDRNAGHMDKASYTFVDKDHFKSKWTWYKDGKEQWMEEFTYQRSKGAAQALVTNGSGSCCDPKG
jgi:hypothetical protein